MCRNPCTGSPTLVPAHTLWISPCETPCLATQTVPSVGRPPNIMAYYPYLAPWYLLMSEVQYTCVVMSRSSLGQVSYIVIIPKAHPHSLFSLPVQNPPPSLLLSWSWMWGIMPYLNVLHLTPNPSPSWVPLTLTPTNLKGWSILIDDSHIRMRQEKEYSPG